MQKTLSKQKKMTPVIQKKGYFLMTIFSRLIPRKPFIVTSTPSSTATCCWKVVEVHPVYIIIRNMMIAIWLSFMIWFPMGRCWTTFPPTSFVRLKTVPSNVGEARVLFGSNPSSNVVGQRLLLVCTWSLVRIMFFWNIIRTIVQWVVTSCGNVAPWRLPITGRRFGHGRQLRLIICVPKFCGMIGRVPAVVMRQDVLKIWLRRCFKGSFGISTK